MNSQRQQMITLESIVTDYIDQTEQSIHKYNKLWNIAYRGMENMGLDFFFSVRSVKLPVESTKIVKLPDDLVQYTKIGVLNSIGEVVPLIFNPKLTTYADLLPDRISKVEDDTLDFFSIFNPQSPIFYNYYNNGDFTNLYGIPSGGYGVGQFNVDTMKGIVTLNPDFLFDYIVLEYLASPQPSEGRDYAVPVQFREAMVAWLGWKDIEFLPTSRRGTVGDKSERRSNFYNQRRLANAQYKPYYQEQAYQLQLQQTRMTVKA